MEKRVFLAIFLSFAVLVVYQAYFSPPPPAAGQEKTNASPIAKAPGTPAAVPPGQPSAPAPAPAPAPPASQPAASPADVSAAAAQDIVVETDTVSAVFTTHGAALKSWKLKRYFDAEHRPLDLVPANIPDSFARPFTLATDDPAVSATLASALFKPSAESLSLGKGAGTLEFEYQDASGLIARKTFEFRPDGHAYLVRLHASVLIGGKAQPVVVQWGPGVGLGYQPGRVARISDAGDPARHGRCSGCPLRIWRSSRGTRARSDSRAIEDQYFLSAALPQRQPESQTIRVSYQPLSLPVPNDPENRTRAFVAYSVRTAGPASLAFYMGPKDLDTLRAVDPELTGAIDFGMFRFLVVPLLQALKWINGYLGNYGWSIVVLTVLINLVIFPLRHRSMVSMRKMQALQPEVKAIQDRYAKYKITDPERQKMNQEMMALYKQTGVNPASGCVPMLLTMPVLFAFYSMLYGVDRAAGRAVLRLAPRPVAARIRYYITPVLMGVTMFWQQRMMPIDRRSRCSRRCSC